MTESIQTRLRRQTLYRFGDAEKAADYSAAIAKATTPEDV